VKLLIQPGDGVEPLVRAIDDAKSSIQIVIFRFDQTEIERALGKAVDRGVRVEALIAHLNGSGESKLRDLEQRLLADGVTVARTPDRLARYHSKYMVIDRGKLYLFGFNLTHHDIDFSRSFGLITEDAELVEEAIKVFEADVQRHNYEAGSDNLIVSPSNAREQLSAFIEGAEKELLIYDPKISDPAIVRLLEARLKQGVDVRIIGSVTRKSTKLSARALEELQLHTRSIIRDRKTAFLGSQSLRTMELDGRREVGAIFEDAAAVKRLVSTFESDWSTAGQPDESKPAVQVAKKVAKAVTKELPPVVPVVEDVIKEMAGSEPVDLDANAVEETLKDAVKEAVKSAVRDVVEKAVDRDANGRGR
jgi:phosphatidylserine/phosphatidylglycerophosphate/cardiolipin synthase-like enzyme